MDKILSTKGSLPSCKILRDQLFILTGHHYKIVTSTDRLKSFPIIRYGNSTGEFQKDTDLNSPDFIRIASSKKRFSEIMQEKEIYSPIYYQREIPETFPVVVRETLNSFGGRGIHVVGDLIEFQKIYKPYYYWTPYIKTKYELRVHILGNSISKIFKKIPLESETEYPIRNNCSCHFSLVDKNKYSKLTELAKTFFEIFSDNFYAIDLGWDSINKKYFVYEINSAPGLNENTGKIYASYIGNKLGLCELNLEMESEQNVHRAEEVG